MEATEMLALMVQKPGCKTGGEAKTLWTTTFAYWVGLNMLFSQHWPVH
jgi:hypothetical protein